MDIYYFGKYMLYFVIFDIIICPESLRTKEASPKNFVNFGLGEKIENVFQTLLI